MLGVDEAWAAFTPKSCITVAQPETVRPTAYDEALSQVDEKIRRVVSQDRDLEELFDSLSAANNKQKEESMIRRGLEKLEGPIKGVNTAIKISSPFAGFNPAASAGLNMLQGVTTLAVGVLGMGGRLDNYIKDMLSQIKVVDECDEMFQQFDDNELIYKALVEVYKDLLLFYYNVVQVLTGKVVAWSWISENINERITPVVHSFLKNAKLLRQHINNANTKSIQSQHMDKKIEQTLGSNYLDEKFYFECTKKTAIDACKWAIADPVFCAWYKATATHPLVLYGEMGSGKTITITFIIEHVTQLQRSIPSALIFYHYCRNDETGMSVYVYSSLIQQLMEKKKHIKAHFCRWIEKKKSEGNYSPTHDPKLLSDFFFDSIKSLQRPVFIFLDGLDECDNDSCKELVTSLGSQSLKIDGLKCCMSVRYHQHIQTALERFPGIKMPKDDAERDKIIVSHLVEQQLSYLKGEARTLVIDLLSKLAKGSAIWVETAVNLLKLRETRAIAKLRAFLVDELPGSKLSDLYAKLFLQVSKNENDRARFLSDALELLATAERPLSMPELAWAVALRGSETRLKTVRDLQDYVEEDRLRGGFLSPFISSFDSEAANSRQVRLAHQSIRELVFRSPPREWAQLRDLTPWSDAVPLERRSQLHGKLAHECVEYLFLAEIGEQDLFSREQEEMATVLFTLPRVGALDDDSSDGNSSADSGMSTPLSETDVHHFDPVERGFGEFFTYASCYWLHHSKKTNRKNGPGLSDVISLLGSGTIRSKNWREQFQHPDCRRKRYDLLMDADDDPLTMVSLYGSAYLFEELLQEVKAGRLSVTEEQRTRVVDTLLRQDDTSRLLGLINFDVEEEVDEAQRLSVRVIRGWHPSYQYQSTAERKSSFDAIFDHIVRGLDFIVDEEWPNELLCIAASRGCLPVLERLFRAASCNPALQQNILQTRHRGNGRLHSAEPHQSVGEAAQSGHGAAVAFLLEQEGIEAHLRYKNLTGRNVLHKAAAHSDVETFKMLLSRYPEGIHETYDDMGSTPLQEAIGSNRPEEIEVGIAKALLEAGADVRCGLDQQPSDWHDPIRMAARWGKLGLIKVLVQVGGADPMSVFKPSQDQDGKLEFIDPFENERQMKVRETLLSLHREQGK
ncbi:wd-repeat protein [Cordyceps militaris]|uniref:Wd-repeat protein n=1 Tax=Cordyceps militaris TaxID=73501 RepID=A0A2H4SGX2_CORMI|nr:wd-repeat protein [Cordyceps militaris]